MWGEGGSEASGEGVGDLGIRGSGRRFTGVRGIWELGSGGSVRDPWVARVGWVASPSLPQSMTDEQREELARREAEPGVKAEITAAMREKREKDEREQKAKQASPREPHPIPSHPIPTLSALAIGDVEARISMVEARLVPWWDLRGSGGSALGTLVGSEGICEGMCLLGDLSTVSGPVGVGGSAVDVGT